MNNNFTAQNSAATGIYNGSELSRLVGLDCRGPEQYLSLDALPTLAPQSWNSKRRCPGRPPAAIGGPRLPGRYDRRSGNGNYQRRAADQGHGNRCRTGKTGGALDRFGPVHDLLGDNYGWLPFVDCPGAGAAAPAGTSAAGWPAGGSGVSAVAWRGAARRPNSCSLPGRRPAGLGFGSLPGVPLPSVLAVYARAASRWPIRSSRSWLTAAVCWRDCRSPRRAALPRREVRRAPASSRLSPAKATAPTTMP